MGSRIRENVKHFFECFCEIVPPTPERDAWILQQFPESYKDEEVLKSIPKFSYPCNFENVVIQHYSFVLTDIKSKWTFGFCRHDPKSQTAIVVLSYLPWHQALYKFLDTIAVLMHSPRAEDLDEFLKTVYNTKLADPGKTFSVPFNKGERTFTVESPKPFGLPSIPENRNLTEYYNAVDVNNMMTVFASMLFERRIIFTSKKLSRLSACVQSANDVIYPMIWQHLFVPVLPMALIDYIFAPMPFLIGVPEDVFKYAAQEVVSSLKKQLKNRSALLGDGVSRAFLRALVQLIGGYRDALEIQPSKEIVFNEANFIKTRSPSLQPFLKQMLHLQIFQQFIEERLQMLNSGLGFSDEFEIEACRYSEKSSSNLKQQYKEWTSTMKKEGTAFFKSVKDKANPAMKSAVRTVKDGGKGVKTAYKGLRAILRDNPSPTQFHNGLESLGDKPRSAPNSPTGKRRTIGFSVPTTSYRKDSLAFRNSTSDRPYSPLSAGSHATSPDASDRSRSDTPGLEIAPIDLMSEMQDLLHLRLDTPPVDRSLKPVRSLENFRNSNSPISSPEHWTFASRSGARALSPSSRLFHSNSNKSQETQNLLLSPDDVLSSPPVPPPRPTTSKQEFFATTPFVVGGGRCENGDPVFYIANHHSVDMVKLSPPTASPRKKVNGMKGCITCFSCGIWCGSCLLLELVYFVLV
ncbi:DENN domain-containing protein 1A-like [Agrilus planipennis]|uniref:DENN domain-containing protein 1A-like n=1 Tax=Agrilus planipennis TaxID=224129 RepID=A0A7F5RJK9_AGRPL|nr:DENN domain-containing protein 1A-like [Agrilus planipennis]